MNSLVVIPFLLGLVDDQYQCAIKTQGVGQEVMFYESHRNQARIFFEQAGNYLVSSHVSEPIQVKVNESGGQISLENQYLVNKIQSHYTSEYCEGHSKSVIPIENLSQDEKVSFVVGAFLNNSSGKCVYNNPVKLEAVKEILTELGYENLKVKTLCKECVPQGFELCISNDPQNLISQSTELLNGAKERLFNDPRWGKKTSLFPKG